MARLIEAEEQYRDILPLARQFVQSQIGYHEVLAFHTAVYDRRDAYGLGSLREAAWKLAEDLRFYHTRSSHHHLD